jgi:hypothetical protein
MTEERAPYIADVALTHLPPRSEPVNWAALYCYSAGIVQDCRETMGYVVMVEEASPDAATFGDWLSEQLTMAGWPNVEVVTEW